MPSNEWLASCKRAIKPVSMNLWALAAVIYFISAYLSQTTFTSYWQIAQAITTGKALAAVLLITKCLSQNYNGLQVSVIALAGLIVATVYFASGTTLFWLFLLTISSQDVSLRRVASSILLAAIPILLVTFSASLLGIISTTVTGRGSSDSFIRRSSGGFINANRFGAMVLNIQIAYLSVRGLQSGYRRVDHLVVIGLTIFGLCVSNSRTSALIGILFYLCCLLAQSRPKHFKCSPISTAGITVLLACLISSILAAIFFDSAIGWERALDALISERFQQWHFAISNIPITLFGIDIESLPSLSAYQHFSLDNSYLYIILRHGCVPALVIFSLIVKYFINARDGAGDSLCSIGLVCLLLYGMFESLLLFPEWSFYIVVALSSLLWNLGTERGTCA